MMWLEEQRENKMKGGDSKMDDDGIGLPTAVCSHCGAELSITGRDGDNNGIIITVAECPCGRTGTIELTFPQK